MIVSVENEVYIFAAMFIVGGIIGVWFDIFKMLRKIELGNVWIFITDLLFWLSAAAVFLFAVMYFNDGQMRWYEFVGVFLGAFLYFLLLSRYITAVFLWTAKIIYKFFGIILKIVLTPLRFLYKILSVPILFVFRIFRRVYIICRNKLIKTESDTTENENCI